MILLKKPIITEKSAKLIQENVYTFEINEDVNKIQLKNFIQSKFNVVVEKVNLLNRLGKKTKRGAIKGQKADRRIAYVTLKTGHTIDSIKGLF
jgi:large subunit ribosomal protein L23